MLPKSLQKGDTIGLIAPSSPLQPDRVESGTRYLESLGFRVKLGPHLKDSERFLAGSDADRASDIMSFFIDSEVKAIMATAGGYGSQRLLPLLDYDIILKNPKIVTGFSDTTALQLALFKKTGLVSYTGFTFRDSDTGKPNPLIERTLLSCLMGKPYSIEEGTKVHDGLVTGCLIGGTLSLISTLMGTPYQPDFKGKILFFEEVWAEPFQVDAMLSQLQQASVFDEVIGIIMGQFEYCVAEHNPLRDGTIHDVLNEWSARFKVPCLKDFPYGHGDRRCVLPIGGQVTLNATKAVVTI